MAGRKTETDRQTTITSWFRVFPPPPPHTHTEKVANRMVTVDQSLYNAVLYLEKKSKSSPAGYTQSFEPKPSYSEIM